MPRTMRWIPPERVVAVELARALVLVPLCSGVADLGASVVFVGSGRKLAARLLGAPASDEELAAIVPAPTEAEDLARFLEDLGQRGLLGVDPSRGESGGATPADGAGQDAAAGTAGPNPVRTPPGTGTAAPTSVEGPPLAVSSPADAASGPALGAAELLLVVRTVFARGLALHFRARGLSMRPQLPDDVRLRIVPKPAAEIGIGSVAFAVIGGERLVAHRVIGREGARLLLRGDSASRVDRVEPGEVLGVVAARIDEVGGQAVEVALEAPRRRFLGLVTGVVWRGLAGVARVLVVAPLRRSATLRAIVRSGMRLVSGCLRRFEDLAFRVRRRADVVRSALLSSEEKDEERRRLYARRAVRRFTALDENLEAGLTLIEEVMLARHPLPAGRLLVLGCGPGREAVALAERGCDVTGLDRDEGMLDLARELAAAKGRRVNFVRGDAADFDLGDERFAAVLALSGLYNMLLPRARREALLAAAARHLVPFGRLYLTFLSDYVAPGAPPPAVRSTLLRAINPSHEEGDRHLVNETVHVFPHGELLVREVERAGLAVVALFRDQRAYDRLRGQIRGYAVLERRS